MKWYNTLLVVGIIGAGCFLVGLTICSEQKFKREAAEAQKNIYKMRLDAALVVIDYYKGKLERIGKGGKWTKVPMIATAYCPCVICCEKWAKIPVSSGKRKTASGHTIRVGDKFVAAPRHYKFGTEMKIPGYNNGEIVTVQDVGGAIKENKLDLYFDTHDLALRWGRQHIEVWVNNS